MTESLSDTAPHRKLTDITLGHAAERHAGNAGLHRAGEVHRVTLGSGRTAWLVTGYEAARAALNDPRLENRTGDVGGGRRMPEHLRRAMNSHMLSMSPPDHTRLRRLVSAAFTRRRTERLRPWIQRRTDALLDALDGEHEVDLIAALALPLPLQVLAELFGIPEEDCDTFHGWTTVLTSSMVPLDRLTATAGEMLDYVRSLLDRKRREPGEDLLSALTAVRDGDDRLSEDELTSMLFLFLVAGHETTVNLIGNGVLSLLGDTAQLDRLRADPALLPAAVEEVLRYESPVQLTARRSTEPLTLGGMDIPAGETVLVSLLAADRDPGRFDAPDRLLLDRGDNAHLAFGHGYHHCLGAPLARLEGVVAIGSLVARFPRLRLARPAETLTWRTSMFHHGLTELPVLLR
ncbi:cytochrome P450 [Actinomadura kijaniata]|uniref:Cytochrome P450 n=1 Tax=Actinomadura namibiensis TaxID=182080 RepID=A0A7W3QMY8_ACTNM|nr:cytochrome P450 [Actinomadura namibiensis]MBA8953039.1 cytochrome P450 [Actinomadura namibiensis]